MREKFKLCERKSFKLCDRKHLSFVRGETFKLGKCHFLPGGRGLLKIGGNQVLFLRSKGGIERFFQIKKRDYLYFLKK